MLIFFLVNITGIFRDYSLNTGGDESVLTAATVKMIADQTLRPNYPTFYHVPLAVYFYLPLFILFFIFLRLSGIFTSLDSIKEFGILNFYNFLPLARLATVLMGLASIYFLYKTAQKLFNNKWISLSAAFFLSSSFMFVQLTHLARVWIPQTMAVVLAFYLIIILYQRREDKFNDYLLVGLSLGLALAVHVIGIIVYSSFIVAHYLKNAPKKLKAIFLVNKYFWLVNLIIILFYFLIYYLNPYGFNNYINREGGLWPNFGFLFDPAATGIGSASNSLFFNIIDWLRNFGYYAKILIEYDPILVLFFIAGAAILFLKARKKFYIIISFILAYYIGATFAGLISNYILPVIPFLALAGGYGLYYFYKKIKAKINQPVAIAVILFIFTLNFMPPLIWDYRLVQPGARLAARDWIYDNIPPGSRIVNFESLLELNENRLSLTDMEKFASNLYTKKRAYLLSRPEAEYPQPNYYVLYYDYFSDLPEVLRSKKYDYLIISWHDKQQLKLRLDQAKLFKSQPVLLKRFPESANENSRYQDLRDMKQPIITVITDKIYSPVIDIYQLR